MVADGHRVLFYDDQNDLIRAVRSFLDEGRARDAGLVAIVTPAHHELFGRADDVVWLDAATTLRSFMTADGPDPAAFDQAVGTVVRGLAHHHASVQAYGEMVALLWEAGDVAGAIALERLWNSLLLTANAALLCAYPLTGDERADAVDLICRLHAEPDAPATPRPEPVERSFAHGTDSPREARRLVTETLSRWKLPHLLDEASIVATELATNSVMHAGTGFIVRITSNSGIVRIEVEDPHPSIPTRKRRHEGLGGRGLALIEALTERWGAEQTLSGKVVWAELAAERNGEAER